MRSALIDVAGVAVRVQARHSLDVVFDRVGNQEARGAPEIDLRIDDEFRLPVEPPQEWAADMRIWWREDPGFEMVYTIDDVGCRVTTDGIVLGRVSDAPSRTDGQVLDEKGLDLLLQVGLASVLASRDRGVVHAASVGRDGRHLLLVGESGKGKSTLSAAALAAGWELAGDDLAVVDTQGADPVVNSVRRQPMCPPGLLEDTWLASQLIEAEADDERGRLRLPVSILHPGPVTLVGIVAVDHDEGPGRIEEVEPGAAPSEMLGALALPPVAPIMRRQLAVFTSLAELPVYRLCHARDDAVRRARAVELLGEIWTAIEGS